MIPESDPAHEIKRALDREVKRRFDPGRFRAIDPAAPPSARTQRTGPLDRIPVPVQWIGIAAAVIAAVTGLRLLYVERVERPATPSLETHGVVQPSVQSVAEAPPAPAAVPPVERPRRRAPAPPEPPKSVPQTVGGGISMDPTVRPTAAAVPAPPTSPSVAQAAPTPTGDASTEPPRIVTPDRERGRASAPSYAPSAVLGGVPATASTGGVRSVRFSTGGLDLGPTILDVPKVGATVVSLVATPGASGTSPSGEPAARERRDTGRMARADAQTSFYVRLMTGAHVSAAATGPLTLVQARSVEEPPRTAREIWGSEDHQAFLRSTFDLKSILALPGERALPATDVGARAGLIASLAGTVYKIAVRAEPAAEPSLQRFEVHLTTADESEEVHGSLLVEGDRVVVLAFPDPHRARFFGPRIGAAGPILFVVLTARADDSGRLAAVDADVDVEPPILIEGPDPRYPDEARALHLAGKVVLRALVRANGSVEDSQVVEAPDAVGATLLGEAARDAVRQRSYLPARRHGEPVDAYVTIPFEFREDGSVDAPTPPGP